MTVVFTRRILRVNKQALTRTNASKSPCKVTKDCKAIGVQEEKDLRKRKELDERRKQPFWARILGLDFRRRSISPPKQDEDLKVESFQFEHLPNFVKEMGHVEKFGDDYMVSVKHQLGKFKKNTKEDEILMKIEYPKDRFYEDECDPMPNFTTVGQRWLDLQKRNLHPLYKKFEMPRNQKRRKQFNEEKYRAKTYNKYELVSGDFDFDELPKKLKYTGMAKKLTFSEYKQPELPKQMVNRLKELEINLRSPLEYKSDVTTEKCSKKSELC